MAAAVRGSGRRAGTPAESRGSAVANSGEVRRTGAALALAGPGYPPASVFAAAYYYPKVPESIIEPLAAAGEHTVDLLREAATPNPDEPDLEAEKRAGAYFTGWHIATNQAGEQAGPVFRPVLEKIERAALQFESGAKAGPEGTQIRKIAEFARQDLDKIAAAK